MALGKLLSLKLSNASESIVLDNLSVGFRIYRTNRLTMNTAEFNIRNLNDKTVKEFIKSGTTIEFKAGWADQTNGEMTTIFIGNVLRQAEIKRETVDRTLSISAGSMANLAGIHAKKLQDIAQATAQDIVDPNLKKKVREDAKAQQARILDSVLFSGKITASLSYGKDTKLTEIIEDIFGAILGLSVNGLDNIANLRLPAPFVHQGSVYLATKKLREILQAFRYSLFIDNTDCRIYNINNPKGMVSVGYLSWTSGLVSLGELVDYTEDLSDNEDHPPTKMLKLTSLLQPKFAPNGVVRVNTPEVLGDFLIETVEFYGDNQEGEFLCDCTVSAYKESLV